MYTYISLKMSSSRQKKNKIGLWLLPPVQWLFCCSLTLLKKRLPTGYCVGKLFHLSKAKQIPMG